MEGSLSLTTNFVLRTTLHLLYLIQQFKILPQKIWLLNMECISNKICTSFKDGKESENDGTIFFTEIFLAALAALYLTLVSDSPPL